MSEKIEQETIRMVHRTGAWPGETLCLKKYPRGDEKPGIMGYSEFGVLTSGSLPLVVYLRPNYTREMKYDSAEALVADGWVVD